MTNRKKRLTRDQEKKVVAGVLSGMADYFGQDPLLFRVMAIVFLIVTGLFPGLIFYIAAWVMMPKKIKESAEEHFDYEVK